MEIHEVDLEIFLTTTFYNPSPERFSPDEPSVNERQIPLVYKCERCAHELSIQPSSFEKHWGSDFTNLEPKDKKLFNSYIEQKKDWKQFSFLDFYCPDCHQATKFLFTGGPSGYWGYFTFEVHCVLVAKPKT